MRIRQARKIATKCVRHKYNKGQIAKALNVIWHQSRSPSGFRVRGLLTDRGFRAVVTEFSNMWNPA